MNSPEAADPAFPSLDSSYLLEEDTLRRNVPEEMTAALAQFGIGFDHVGYVAAVPRVMEEEDRIYLNWFDPRNGVVIANTNDKRADLSPNDERLFPSEIIWQSWWPQRKRVDTKDSQSFTTSAIYRLKGTASAVSEISRGQCEPSAPHAKTLPRKDHHLPRDPRRWRSSHLSGTPSQKRQP